MKPVILRPGARLDLKHARDWYRKEQPGLDEDLRVEVGRVLAAIAENPHSYQRVHRGVRRALTKRFPYKIFYRDESDRIEVLAIRHQSQKPLPGVEG